MYCKLHRRHQHTFHSTGETYHIKSHITCTTFNVIYVIQCRLCNLQYIGETKRRLKDRFNEHRRPALNPTSSYIHTAVSEHFLSNNHSDTHMLLIPIEKLKNERDSFRKAREAHIIHKAKGAVINYWRGGRSGKMSQKEGPKILTLLKLRSKNLGPPHNISPNNCDPPPKWDWSLFDLF